MNIILDAMGGDNAPLAPVMGAVDASRRTIILPWFLTEILTYLMSLPVVSLVSR